MSDLGPYTTISLKGPDTTPSLLYNNLASVDEWIAYVHKGDAVVANIRSPDAPVIRRPLADGEDRVVSQVRAAEIMGVPVLLAATAGGLVLCDLAKERVLATYDCEGGKDVFQSRGIAVIEQRSSCLIFLGHSDGTISVLEYDGAGAITKVKTLEEHRDSITDIAAGHVEGLGYVVASADASGELHVWSEELEMLGSAAFAGDTLTSLQVFDRYIAASFGSGLIKLYNAKGCTEAVEVAAHARWINATAYLPEKRLLASVSEDMLLCVWEMPCKENDMKVRLHKHALLKDCVLTGVRFFGNSIVCSAYDWDRVFAFNDWQ